MCLIYLLQAFPVKLPAGFLRDLRTSFLNFLWAGKPARLKTSMLTLSKMKGRNRFPNPVKYQEATHLTRVVDWCKQYDMKPWFQLEQTVIDSPLAGLPCLPERSITASTKLHPLIGVTLQAPRVIYWSTSLSPSPSPRIPVLGTPDFLHSRDDPQFAAPI